MPKHDRGFDRTINAVSTEAWNRLRKYSVRERRRRQSVRVLACTGHPIAEHAKETLRCSTASCHTFSGSCLLKLSVRRIPSRALLLTTSLAFPAFRVLHQAASLRGLISRYSLLITKTPLTTLALTSPSPQHRQPSSHLIRSITYYSRPTTKRYS